MHAHLVEILDKRMQQAQHEQLVLKLASAYKDYVIIFPAFIYITL